MYDSRTVWRVTSYVIKPALESNQNHDQHYHEPAVEAVVAMVAHRRERLGIERQVPPADAGMLFQLPLGQTYPVLTVIRVDFAALARGVLALAVVYGMVIVSRALKLLYAVC